MPDASAGLASAIGLVFDRVVGEPPDRVHPVVLMGRGLTALEGRTYADDRWAGVAHTACGVAVAAAVGAGLQSLVGRRAAVAVSVGTASAGSMLGRVATDVGDRLESGDLDAARTAIRSLVGRDPSGLDETELARAVIESVAENTVDAVTATLFWAAVAGAPGIWIHRTINTLDAMVGHRSERYRNFGWASARLDDGANWLPARLTALAVAVAVPSRAGVVLETVRRDGRRHPSPNGGVVEAAWAGALDLTLGGVNDYDGRVEIRGPLGDGRQPRGDDIARAVRLARRVPWIALGLQAAPAVGFRVARLTK